MSKFFEETQKDIEKVLDERKRLESWQVSQVLRREEVKQLLLLQNILIIISEAQGTATLFDLASLRKQEAILSSNSILHAAGNGTNLLIVTAEGMLLSHYFINLREILIFTLRDENLTKIKAIPNAADAICSVSSFHIAKFAVFNDVKLCEQNGTVYQIFYGRCYAEKVKCYQIDEELISSHWISNEFLLCFHKKSLCLYKYNNSEGSQRLYESDEVILGMRIMEDETTKLKFNFFTGTRLLFGCLTKEEGSKHFEFELVSSVILESEGLRFFNVFANYDSFYAILEAQGPSLYISSKSLETNEDFKVTQRIILPTEFSNPNSIIFADTSKILVLDNSGLLLIQKKVGLNSFLSILHQNSDVLWTTQQFFQFYHFLPNSSTSPASQRKRKRVANRSLYEQLASMNRKELIQYIKSLNERDLEQVQLVADSSSYTECLAAIHLRRREFSKFIDVCVGRNFINLIRDAFISYRNDPVSAVQLLECAEAKGLDSHLLSILSPAIQNSSHSARLEVSTVRKDLLEMRLHERIFIIGATVHREKYLELLNQLIRSNSEAYTLPPQPTCSICKNPLLRKVQETRSKKQEKPTGKLTLFKSCRHVICPMCQSSIAVKSPKNSIECPLCHSASVSYTHLTLPTIYSV
eukprot:TRINITY_DN11922_c0_g1_i1.p1 TRINITY_DN11922_c0_g1~~TRINITY_DN11922_c0_g1_i1.p1  ORF type:complete len:639 (+),score=90.77 TRINITY_DN11922_c0_g1_i1:199-2115(+)